MRCALLFVLATLTAAPSAIHGQEEANTRPQAVPTYDRIVVINLTTPTAAADSRVVTVAPDSSLLANLDRAATARENDKTNAKELLDSVEAHQLKPANRWIATSGARLAVYVFHDDKTVANVRFNEEARRTRLAADLLVLAELGLQLAVPQDAAVTLVTKQEYTLRRPRANLTITATLTAQTAPVAQARTNSAGITSAGAGTTGGNAPAPAPQAGTGSAGAGTAGGNVAATPPASAPQPGTGAAGAGAAAGNAAAAKPAEQPSASITVVTGPSEHLFLSTNAGATDASALKYDDESNSLQLKESPTGFFIGFNYSFGDILTDPAATDASVLRKFWKGMYVGGAVQGSRRPFDQAGVHLGFRYNPLPLLGDVLNFETVSPYVGLVWTKNDQVDGEGNRLGERRYGRRELVWGVSLNLDKALGWVGGGEN